MDRIDGASMLTWHDKGRAERQLLVFIEEVVGVLVEDHAANGLQREQVLWPDLGHIQRVKVELVLILRVHCLHNIQTQKSESRPANRIPSTTVVQ